MRPHFRFEDLEVWRLARAFAVEYHRRADQLDERKYFRYAEQLRAAGLLPSNNIAEGSGSLHNTEFRHFLNIARRSVFECASMTLVFESMTLVTDEEAGPLLAGCDELSRKITNFSRSL